MAITEQPTNTPRRTIPKVAPSRVAIRPEGASKSKYPTGIANSHGLRQKAIQPLSEIVAERAAQYGETGQILHITLTYADEASIQEHNASSFLAKVARKASKRSATFSYIWRLERGAKHGRLHYHILLLIQGYRLCPETVQRWFPAGRTVMKNVSSRSTNHLCEYVLKTDDSSSRTPGKSRSWSYGGFSKEEKERVRWAMAPLWVRLYFEPEDKPRRAPKGGWKSSNSVHIQPSPYKLLPTQGFVLQPGDAWQGPREQEIISKLLLWERMWRSGRAPC